MRIRFVRTVALSTATAVAAITFLTTTPAQADTNDTVTPAEVAAALNKTNGKNDNLVGEPIPTKTDADSAAVVATTDGTFLDIPKDAEEGVTLGAKGEVPITIGLPGADNAANAKKLPDGTIVYPGAEGSANAIVPTESGPQMLVTIADDDAPTEYRYPIENGTPELAKAGTVVIKNANGEMVTVVPAPYAKEVNSGKSLTGVHYTIEGNELVLHVPHTSQNVQYPIVADPWFARVINMILGCFGLRDLARMGLARAAWVGGRQVIVRLIPWAGWVSCGIGAYAGWNG